MKEPAPKPKCPWDRKEESLNFIKGFLCIRCRYGFEAVSEINRRRVLVVYV